MVLIGGSGTRLWPLSRQNQPKQFLSLIGDHSLFQASILRASALPGAQRPVTVCSEEHRFMVGEQLQAIGMASGGIALAALHVLRGRGRLRRARVRPAREPEHLHPTGLRAPLAQPRQRAGRLIEVQSGSYLGEGDIVRLEDVYGRC